MIIIREILFKAKVKDWKQKPKDEQWVYGYYVKGFDVYEQQIHIIFDPTTIFYSHGETDGWDEIDPDTLCQYTGKTDKNSKKIWEGDILKGFQYPYLSDGEHNYFAEVTWFYNCPAFGVYTFKNPKSKVSGISEGNTEFMEEWNPNDWEVIGNIFDNPELIKKPLNATF